MSLHTLLSILLKPPPPQSVFPIDTLLSCSVDFLNTIPSHFVTLSCGKKNQQSHYDHYVQLATDLIVSHRQSCGQD